MVFLVGMPLVAGLSNYLMPLMIGARDMAFPRLERIRFLDLPVWRPPPLLQLSSVGAGFAAPVPLPMWAGSRTRR